MNGRKDRRLALQKPHQKITRRILVATLEEERRPLLEDVKQRARLGIDQVLSASQRLRKEHGILLPLVAPEWDWVPTVEGTPSHTLLAFEGNTSEVRVSLHLDPLVDNTTATQLDGHGISHLVGISISSQVPPVLNPSPEGAMLAIVESSIAALPSLLHDMLLDMAMGHATAQAWTGMRMHLSAPVLSTLKAQFVQERNLISGFTYGSGTGNQYFPFAAFTRKPVGADTETADAVDLAAYVALWNQFAAFVQREIDLPIPGNTAPLAKRIMRAHVNGGQISPGKLDRAIGQLAPGHYCLYFLLRRSDQTQKVAELSAFFQVSKSHFRTQRWIIYPRDEAARTAAKHMQERYISVFPFYVGELP